MGFSGRPWKIHHFSALLPPGSQMEGWRKWLTAKFSGGMSGMQLLRITLKTRGDKEASWERPNPAEGVKKTSCFFFRSRIISSNTSKEIRQAKRNVTNYVSQGWDLCCFPAAGVSKRCLSQTSQLLSCGSGALHAAHFRDCIPETRTHPQSWCQSQEREGGLWRGTDLNCSRLSCISSLDVRPQMKRSSATMSSDLSCGADRPLWLATAFQIDATWPVRKMSSVINSSVWPFCDHSSGSNKVSILYCFQWTTFFFF